ncbi:reverse transcriptase domain-containing protein [Tanacetum coccineum]|uniref:Reverse transcriptase domain-containing protein n=1 Tax=Tanacetum coccineum TaxID=301880 RepID=A0ABQ5FHR2_9ASTR
MANGANIATSENRVCGTFNIYMDELCCDKITISIKWDHREARSQENSGSPVNRSWNVKIPSSGRNTHTAKQQNYPTRMHDGLRTGITAFRYHPSCEGKNQSNNSSGIPRANNSNRFYSNGRRTKGVLDKKRSQAPERNKAIQKEVEKLVDVGIMKEVINHSGLQSMVIEAEAEFKQMKKLIAELPILTAPMEKEELIVHLMAAREAVSAVLMTKREAKQMPIYFVSCALQGPEIIYTPMEKLVLDLVHANGSSCIDGLGAGLILTSPEGIEFTYALRFEFDATNNEAEYEALIAGLGITEQMEIKKPSSIWKLKTLANILKKFSIKQVPRSENKKADILSKIASTSFAHSTKQVLVEVLKEKSINKAEVLTVMEEEGNTWMTSIYEYLTEETLPVKKKKARAVRLKSRWYAVINGVLYKKSFLEPWLRCVGPLQANYVLREIHEGSCSMHARPRSVVAKAIRTGYYWPTKHKDARKVIRECQDYQVHRLVPRNPHQKLTPITSPWPFYKWGIDITGPFPEGPDKVKFLILAIGYFTKWIEAKPATTITGNQIKTFV